jgi:hypothetical protein
VPRTFLVVCLGLLISPAPGVAQKTPSAAATAVTTSAAPMFTVTRLLVEDTWNPLLDQRIQESQAGRGLGTAWKPSDARWQKARASLAARMTRLLTAYQGSHEIESRIEAEVGTIGQSKDLDDVIAALRGPAGAAIVRQQAKQTYMIHAMLAGGPSPNGPAIGSPEWSAHLREMGTRFEERAGADVPADDGTHKADVEKLYAARPTADVLRRIWDAGVDNAIRQLDTAMNLMLFDNQDAIEKDIAGAAGPPAAGAAPATPAAAFPLEQMATCKDSWLEWGADDTRVGAYRDSFAAQFRQNEGSPFFVPIAGVTLLGMPVVRVFANSVGMAKGFSVGVDAPFDAAKKNVERLLGKTLSHCETGDGVRACQLEIADKKTVMLLGDATGKEKGTIVGCFYFYEK